MSSAPDQETISAGRNNVAARTRRSILMAAAHIFAARGYHAASMTDVQAAVGCSRGTLYYHFSSKDEILFEICLSSTERQLREAKEIAARGDSAEDTVALLVDSVLGEIFTHRDSVLVIQRELESLTQERRLTIRSMRDEYETVWADLFGRAVKEGHFRSVDHIELKALLGMLVHVGSWVREGPIKRVELVDRFAGLILRSVRV
ncbi:TetR/AcrR family transcriptional regulator [Ornithinimicrobium cavernae]|uniref:TetR/AcrR family transcriptional regulator n=1 Tax=Ornithinimicrobium cavernae TaxID=2666047 RepID=UPI0012B17982|nr:TetR/AcrR family transcriptional regulator [Ornithinimicrobium cavernae]